MVIFLLFALFLLGMFLLSELFVRLIWVANKKKKSEQVSWIIALCCVGDETSTVTLDRVTNLVLAAKENPNAVVVICGDEVKKEVSTFQKLIAGQIQNQILLETESKNTWQNLRFAKKLFEEQIKFQEKSGLIVTSQYHQPRALAMAWSLGIKAKPFGIDKRVYKMKTLFFWKERFSNLKYFLPMLLRLFIRGH